MTAGVDPRDGFDPDRPPWHVWAENTRFSEKGTRTVGRPPECVKRIVALKNVA